MLWGSPVALGEPSRVLKDGQEFARQSRSKNGTGRPEAHWELPSRLSPPPPRTPRAGPCPQECMLRALQAPSTGQVLAGHLHQKTRERQRVEERRGDAEAESGRSPQSSGPERPGPARRAHTVRGPRAAGSKVLQPVSAAGSVTGVGAQPAGSPTTSPRALASSSCLSFLCRGRQDSPRRRPEPGTEKPEPVRLAQRYQHCHLCCHRPQKLRATAAWTQTRCWGTWRKCPPPGRPAGRHPKDGQAVGASGLHLSEAWTGVWGLPPQHWCPGPRSDAGASRTHPDCAGPRDRLSLCLGGRELQPAWSQP